MSRGSSWREVEAFLDGLEGVRRHEAHEKVLADVGSGDVAAVCAALRDAWEMQRG